MNSDRISHETLIAYAAGELGAEDARRVEDWLESHPDALETVHRFREIRRQVAADAADAPPAELIARAKAIFTISTATPWKQWLEKIDAIVATLVFDSRLQPAAVRDDAAGDRVQLAFESDAADIDLQLHRQQPGPGGTARWRVMGQVAADGDVDSRRVVLLASGSRDRREQTVTDERGMFEFDADSGVYDLAVEMPGQEVLLPGIRMD